MPELTSVMHVYLSLDRATYTTNNYRRCLSKLVAAIGPHRDITLVTFADLADYCGKLRTSVSASTFKQYVTIIKCFFNWSVKVGYIQHSPAAQLIARKPPKDPGRSRAMPPDLLEKLIAAVQYHPRNHALVLLFADTGARVSSVASLTLSRLDIQHRAVIYHQKGDRYYRSFYSDTTAAALRTWLEERPEAPHDFVFTTKEARRFSKAGIQTLIRNLTQKICGQGYGPHSIRHAVGHGMAKAGYPITVTQRKLGHSDPGITMSAYYPDDDEYLAEVSRQFALPALQTHKKGRAEDAPRSPKILRLEDYG